MAETYLQKFFHLILSPIPWPHWLAISILSIALAVFLVMRKKSSLYGGMVSGLTLFFGLVLLETAVLTRFMGYFSHVAGNGVNWGFDRFLHGGVYNWVELFSNFAVFVPFGFFFSESFSSSKRFGAWRRIRFAAWAGLGFSLLIESLQLVLHVGFFEVSDLLLNTAGTFFGAAVAVMGRKVFGLDNI